MKVGDVEGAVGTGGELDGAKSFIGGDEEIDIGVGAGGGEGGTFGGEDLSGDEIGGGFADEGVATEFLGELLASVNEGATGGGDGGHDAAGADATISAINSCGEATGKDRAFGDGASVTAGIFWGAFGVFLGDEIGVEHGAIGVIKEAAEVILGEAVLAALGGGFADPLSRDLAEAPAEVGTVEPVIEGEERPVGIIFWATAFSIVCKNGSFFVALAVAVMVATEPQIGGFADDHSAVGEGDGAWEDEAIEKDGAFVEFSVCVGVFEDDDIPSGLIFALAVGVWHVAAHFDDEEAAIGIEGEGDGILDEGFAGDEFDAEAWRETKGSDGGLASEDWGGRGSPRKFGLLLGEVTAWGSGKRGGD